MKRKPDRGRYDKATIYPIVDEALFCHVGFVVDGRPHVIPTLTPGKRIASCCTEQKGAARSKRSRPEGPSASQSPRSAVLFGRGERIEGEKRTALEIRTERMIRERWGEARRLTPQELDATAVVAVPIGSASAKIRTGSPVDDERDYDLPVWAGVLPIRQAVGNPQRDPRLKEGIPLPPSVVAYQRPAPEPVQKLHKD